MKSLSSKKLTITFFSIILILQLLMIFSSHVFAYSSYMWTSPSSLTLEVSNNLSNNIDDASNPLNLDCGSCILIEQKTGQILYSYNCQKECIKI